MHKLEITVSGDAQWNTRGRKGEVEETDIATKEKRSVAHKSIRNNTSGWHINSCRSFFHRRRAHRGVSQIPFADETTFSPLSGSIVHRGGCIRVARPQCLLLWLKNSCNPETSVDSLTSFTGGVSASSSTGCYPLPSVAHRPVCY